MNPRVHKASREEIVNAALLLIDRVGVGRLTIRGVAKKVDVPTMSLYGHFASKDELLDLMYAEVARRLYAPHGHDTWQAELRALCHQLHDLLLEHPTWVDLLSRTAPATHVPRFERLLALFSRDGMEPAAALGAVSSAILTAIGWALLELEYRQPAGSTSFGQRFAGLKRQLEDASAAIDEPLMRAAVASTPRLDFKERFSHAMQTFVAGLEVSRRAPPRIASVD